MGTTEDAARMRVNRGLEKLRKFFIMRGVTMSAAAIAGAVAANSVQAAPAGLAGAVTTAALSGTTITTAAVLAATKAVAMTTIQKTLIAATVALAVGALIYETRSHSRYQTLRQERESAGRIEALTRERDAAMLQLAGLREENARLSLNTAELLKLRGELAQWRAAPTRTLPPKADGNSAESAASEAALRSWIGRARELKGLKERMPDRTIPELRILTEEDWLDLAKEPLGHSAKEVNLNDEATARLVFSAVRAKAKDKLMRVFSRALEGYAGANDGQLPKNVFDLQPYLMTSSFRGPARVVDIPESALDETVLQRYEVVLTGKLQDVPEETPILLEKSPVDGEYDTRLEVGKNWMAIGDIGEYSQGKSNGTP
jgi:hypothetical protein